MIRIMIDCSEMTTYLEAHAYLARELSFPEYYGANLDALHDCLGDISEETHVTILNSAEIQNNLGTYGLRLLEVFEQSARENDLLTINMIERDTW